jgi:hypothetical protein
MKVPKRNAVINRARVGEFGSLRAFGYFVMEIESEKTEEWGGVVFVFAAKVRAGRMCGGGKTHVWFVFFWINKRNEL